MANRNFGFTYTDSAGSIVSGATVELLPDGGSYPGGALTLTEVSTTGYYKADVPEGVAYHIYIGGVKQTGLGLQLHPQLGTFIETDGTATVAANIPMATYKLTGLGAGSSAGDSVRYEQVGLLAANNTWVGINSFSCTACTLTYKTPTTNTEVATKLYVDTEVAKITPDQVSANEVQIIMSGTEDTTNHIYTTLAAGLTYAATQAAVNKLMVVHIKDVNTASNLAINSAIATNYVWVKSLCNNWGITLANLSATVTAGASGFENCKLSIGNYGGSTTTTLNGYRFENGCRIEYDGTLNLTNCIFGAGFRIKMLSDGGTITLTNCTGSPFAINTDPVISGTCPSFAVDSYL